MIVLSPELANEIRNNANLSFVHVTERVRHQLSPVRPLRDPCPVALLQY